MALASISSVVEGRVVMAAKASIRSWSCGLDSSSEEVRSGGGWALFLFLGIVIFLAGLIRVFNFEAMLKNSPRENKYTRVFQAAAEY